MLSILLTIMSLMGPLAAEERENLVFIKQVSSSGQSFIIRQGAKDGIIDGNEGLFTTKNSRFRARAIQISHFASLWKILDARSRVPFKKGDMVLFTRAPNDLNIQVEKVITPQKKASFEDKKAFWKTRIGASTALSETASTQSSGDNTSRRGLHLSFMRSHIYQANWELSYGLRYDREGYTQSSVNANATSTRFIGMLEGLYHFDFLSKATGRYFAGIALGYGTSSTSILGATSTGTTTLLPTFKVGYESNWGTNKKWLIEGAIESLSQKESFSDTGDQSLNIISSRINFGLKF